MSLDILNLEWANSDRDLHITTPILLYLNKKYALRYQTKSIHNGYFYLFLYRPKILLISNFQGGGINNSIVSLANYMGIKVISLISEGNVVEEDVEQFFWGHNLKQELEVEALLVWSERSRQLFLNKYSKYKDKIITVGATGFDRYKLLVPEGKNDFLTNNHLEEYKKIIGIAGWGFDLLYGNYFEKYKEYYIQIWGKNQIEMHKQDMYKLQNIYKELIESNQEVLFILRYHPGTIDFEKNEFYGLNKYKNVFISNTFKNNHYKISDLINISDLWIGYETTTALEAWLLNKKTFLINPTKVDFIREMTYIGSPIVKTKQEAQLIIEELFNYNSIEDFEKLNKNREKIIKDVIEYADGKNHIRAAKEIMKIYNQPNKKRKFSVKLYARMFKQLLKLILSKTIMKKRWPELNYKSDFSKPYQEMYDKVINV